MKKLEQLYEGKAKKVYKTDDENCYIVYYKDDATALNGLKKGTIEGKGIINNRLTNHFMQLVEAAGVPTHFVEQLSDRETVVRKVTIVPLEVIVRNIAAGSLAKRLGLEEGVAMKTPVLQYCYKNDALADPMVNDSEILAMEWATRQELDTIARYANKVNEVLGAYLEKVGVRLIDFKLEFGRTPDGAIILADEISPDTCRFWDMETNAHLDKDRFRRDLGDVTGGYLEMEKRILGK